MTSELSTTKRVGLILGPTLFVVVLFLQVDPGNPDAGRMLAVAALVSTWWITEAIPLAATALLPLILFPVLGIETGAATAPLYFNSTIVLFIGGFIIALVMEKWNLHRRIALNIIGRIGGGASRIVLGIMVATAFISMWISNTAAAVMMLPIGLAIVLEMEETFGTEATRPFSIGVMLGIAWASSIGGVATLVGSPTNLSLVRIFQITFPEAPAISFGQWMIVAFPISAIMLVIAWLVITKVFYRLPEEIKPDSGMIKQQVAALGPMSFEEKVIGAIFGATAFLWVFRAPIPVGEVVIPGWSQLLPFGSSLDDGTVGITMAALLFMIPTRSPNAPTPTLAGPEIITGLPWNIVLLFGGGFALAQGFTVTGLSAVIGNQFAGLTEVPPLLMVLGVCAILTFLTELTSNTATVEMVLPVLAAVAVATEVHPLLLMIPATISASLGFMMPGGTPPNAIVFGSSRLAIVDMARTGFVVNLAAIVIATVVFYLLGPATFDISSVMPDWATLATPAAAP